MRCGRCHFDNPTGMNFCGECGTALAHPCPQCGFENPAPFKFCGACGTPLTGQTTTASSLPAAERRQLTVMFCDLVDSTKLSWQRDPEEYHDVIRDYQATCAAVAQRFDGLIAQYLGDGLIVYFGWPQAHEDDAQRAVRAGLEMLDAMGALNRRLDGEKGVRLDVRVGIHTGLVVVGEIKGTDYQDQQALGDTPNMASRLQGLAAPNTVVISNATFRLVQGYFDCDDRGPHLLKGIATPQQVYRVLQDSGAQSRLEVAAASGLTPLIGREHEVTLLLKCWEQVKDGWGQIVLLSGASGIGKSRLVQCLKEQVGPTSHLLLECRCSPYHTHSALQPLIDLWERLLAFRRPESVETKIQKLEALLADHAVAVDETVPLLAALLSLPLPADRYPPRNLSPQQQKQKTLRVLQELLHVFAAHQPVLLIVEDLHWIDPSTLAWLQLLSEQTPAGALLIVLTCRPTFQVPTSMHNALMHLGLNRLTPEQVERMVTGMTHGKPLPADVLLQIMTKTDGIPLFVEELTKMVLESGLLRESDGQYILTGTLPPLAIPTTLQDSLMARLDQLATAKAVAQLAATIGRESAYELLQAVSPFAEARLREGLQQLVAAELLYQYGAIPQATYSFKHALIQEAAYQSLLRRTRQQYHQRVAQVLEAQFAETVGNRPELLAYHFTEAGLLEPAVHYWQKAQQAGAPIFSCSWPRSINMQVSKKRRWQSCRKC